MTFEHPNSSINHRSNTMEKPRQFVLGVRMLEKQGDAVFECYIEEWEKLVILWFEHLCAELECTEA